MSSSLFNIWPFNAMKICPKAHQIRQSRFEFFPNTQTAFVASLEPLGHSATSLPAFQRSVTNGPNPASFCSFSFFSQYKDKCRTNLTTNYKSIEGMLGSQTRAAGLKAPTNPLSHGGTPPTKCLSANDVVYANSQLFRQPKFPPTWLPFKFPLCDENKSQLYTLNVGFHLGKI